MLKRLENWVFYIFLFSIPISIRHIFGYEPFNFIEWSSVYIYLTDIIFLILLGFWIKSKSLQFTVYSLQKADWFLIGFVIVAGISISNALDVQTAVFQWVKLIEGVALYFYIKEYAVKRFELALALKAIVFSGVFQAVIGIIQFTTQGSLGLKYLGESPLVPAMSGIAAFFVDGIKIIRAYGTTPHSNILALYLFIALGAFYSITIYQKRGWIWHVFHTVILWGFFLTFSRTIIGMWSVSFILISLLAIRTLKSSSGKRLTAVGEPTVRQLADGFMGLGERVWIANFRKIFLTTITVGVLFALAYWPYVVNRSYISSTDEAVQLRVLYNQKSMAGGDNMFGLGMGNFVPWLMTQDLHLDRGLYQPVHNIYLLIYSETGIFGVALFILFLAFLLYDFYHRFDSKKLQHFLLLFSILAILVFGLFDHYLWTIQAGRLIFWMILGLLASFGRFDKFYQ